MDRGEERSDRDISISADDLLKLTLRERAVAIGRGLAGVVPYAGPILAEIVGIVIPDLRLERVVEF